MADDPHGLPIDSREPTPTQSRQALMLATEMGLLNYRWPVDTSLPDDVARLRAELGPEAQLPTDGGMYYLAYVTYTVFGGVTQKNHQQAVLIPEGDPRAMVFALALARSPELARRVQYKLGMLPA